MKRIDELYAFIIEDKEADCEGVPGASMGGGLVMPLMGADLDRMKSFIPALKQRGVLDKAKLYRFTNKIEVEF